MCGGTLLRQRCICKIAGLSPRVRGNRVVDGCKVSGPGSIPACAGEPRPKQAGPGQRGVYPRVCGGTPQSFREKARVKGLSPRVRGNPREGAAQYHLRGSIPACAGEPICSNSVTTANRVYPRVCGGTCFRASVACPTLGLSPRVRGNPVLLALPASLGRSIPACAGEPRVGLGAGKG